MNTLANVSETIKGVRFWYCAMTLFSDKFSGLHYNSTWTWARGNVVYARIYLTSQLHYTILLVHFCNKPFIWLINVTCRNKVDCDLIWFDLIICDENEIRYLLKGHSVIQFYNTQTDWYLEEFRTTAIPCTKVSLEETSCSMYYDWSNNETNPYWWELFPGWLK